MLLRKRVAPFIVLCFCVSGALQAAPLRIRADSWMPFNGAPADEKPGYVVELLREIFGAESVDYQTLAWDEALKAARAGQIDAVIGANKTEAEGLVVPQEPIGLPRFALFVARRSTWQYENIGSLKNVRLGVIAGYSYWEALDTYIKRQSGDKIVILTGDSPLQDGIKKLNAGELDVVAESIAVFTWNVHAAGLNMTGFRTAYSYVGEPIYVAFAATDAGAKNAKKFDQGLRELRTSGKLELILRPYGLHDWEQ